LFDGHDVLFVVIDKRFDVIFRKSQAEIVNGDDDTRQRDVAFLERKFVTASNAGFIYYLTLPL